ncbi:MAG: cation diffusion facilitator family transporter [Desulfovibrionaceae bacterium]
MSEQRRIKISAGPKNRTTREARLRLVAISISLGVGALLMGAKFLAWSLTDSSAILSDALESIINVVAAGFAVLTIVVANRPPDQEHPYGHGKMEYFSAGFEGSLIILAALTIIAEAWGKIFHPQPLGHLGVGLLITAGAGAVNLVMGVAIIGVGKKTRSLALTADGKHLLTDVWTSGGVVVGLALTMLTGWTWLDGAVACMVAANILFAGVSVVREAFGGLMNQTDPEVLHAICEALTRHRSDHWIDVHKLRAWRSGSMAYADFHLVLPSEWSFKQAHDEATRVEEVLMEEVPGLAGVMIHPDPCDEELCPECDRDPCEVRQELCTSKRIWDRETATYGIFEDSVEKKEGETITADAGRKDRQP